MEITKTGLGAIHDFLREEIVDCLQGAKTVIHRGCGSVVERSLSMGEVASSILANSRLNFFAFYQSK